MKERGMLNKEATAEEVEWVYGLWYLMVQLETTWKSLIFKVTSLRGLKQTLYHHQPLLKISGRHSEAVPRDLQARQEQALSLAPIQALYAKADLGKVSAL